MGRSEGLVRLQRGVSRKLWESERNRGYLFVSADKKIKELCGPHGCEVILNGTSIGRKRIDNSGRISVGKKIIEKIGQRELVLRRINKKITIDY